MFLTTGSKDLPRFCANEELRVRIYARVLPIKRSLDICAECGIPGERIIAMQGPFEEELNAAMFRMADARYVVTKDTGSAGGYAEKIRAAQKAGAQAVIIGRPQQADGVGLDELAIRIEERFGLMPLRKKVSLVGIGMGDRASHTVGMERVLRQADSLIGAQRMLESVDTQGKPVMRRSLPRISRRSSVTIPAAGIFAILLSGDTGFTVVRGNWPVC